MTSVEGNQNPDLEDRPAPAEFNPRSLVVVAAGLLAGLSVIAVGGRSARVLGWFVAALVLASLLGACVRRLESHIGHPAAVGLTALGLLVGAVALGFILTGELRREFAHVQTGVPNAIARLERSARWGRSVRDFQLRQKTNRFLEDLPGRLAGGTPAQAARLAGTRLVAFLAGLVLTCFLCAGGRKTFEGLVAWYPQREGQLLNRHAVKQVLERAHRRTSDFLLFSAAKGVVLAIGVSLVFWVAGLPGPTIFGLSFGAVSLVPGVGVALGGSVAAALTVGFTSGRTTWLCLVAVLVAVVGERYACKRATDRGLLDIGPAIGTAAFLAGFELGGVGTAVCLIAFSVFAASLWSEVVRLRALQIEPPRRAVRPSPWRQSASGENQALVALFAATLALVVMARVGRTLLHNLRRTSALVAISIVLAIALGRVISPLAARLGGRRRSATALVGGAALLVLGGGGAVLAPIASNKIRSFRRELPQMTKRLADLPFIGRRFRDANTSAKIERWLQQLPHDLNRNSAKIGRTILGAADAAFAVLVVVTLAFAFSIDGPRLLRSARRSFSPATRRRFDQSCRVTSEVVGRYFAGTVFVASLAGINALIVGLALGVVLAPLAAIWIAVTNVIPQIGGFLGGVVLVALGFASGTGAGLGCLVYFLVYQQFENHVIQPAVIGRAVEMSPAATMLTALVGGSALGLPGALISVPLVGAAKSVTRQLAGPRAPAKPSADEPRPTRRSQLRR